MAVSEQAQLTHIVYVLHVPAEVHRMCLLYFQVSNQNGVSLQWYIVQIHPSGQKPSVHTENKKHPHTWGVYVFRVWHSPFWEKIYYHPYEDTINSTAALA